MLRLLFTVHYPLSTVRKMVVFVPEEGEGKDD